MAVHPSVRIHPSARIECDDLTIGAGGVVGRDCVIEGRRVVVGRDLWMDDGAHIGGGSCNDPSAYLEAGNWLHMGRRSHINTGRGVTIGDEVGIGIGSSIFTHGAYLDELAGFPVDFAAVKIGSRVWLPHAWVNPGVTIGDDVVVAAMSAVNRDLPSKCLAGGVPVKILRENVYPRVLTSEQKVAVLDAVVAEVRCIAPMAAVTRDELCIVAAEVNADAMTIFNTESRNITGPVGAISECVRNQLRRHGIRFRFSPGAGRYNPWNES